MSTDTDLFAAEVRDHLALADLHADLDPYAVLRRSRRARRRRAVVASAAAAATLAVALLAGPPLVGLGQRLADAAQRTRLADVDGIATDLSGPLRTGWQVDGRLVGVSEPSGTVVVDDGSTVAALDPATGHELWSTRTDSAADCSLSRPDVPAPTGAQDPEGPELMLCTGAPGAGRLELRQVATGAVVVARTVDWPFWSASFVGARVVAVGVDDQDHAVARAWDTGDGAVAWDYRSTSPLTDVGRGLELAVHPWSLRIVAGSQSVDLDPTTGAELPASSTVRTLSQGTRTLADGATVEQHYTQDASGTVDHAVVLVPPARTSLRWQPGWLDDLTVDDGSVPGLVYVHHGAQDSTMTVVDSATGDQLWSAHATPVALVDRRLILRTDDGDLSVVDARSGAVIWSQRVYVPDGGAPTPVTDGTTVLSVEKTSGQTSLVARSLASGTVVWAEPWDPADGTTLGTLPGGTVLARADGRVTALVP